jgi:hypothetical protein
MILKSKMRCLPDYVNGGKKVGGKNFNLELSLTFSSSKLIVLQ